MNSGNGEMRVIKTREKPVVTWGLAALSVLVYLVQYLSKQFRGIDLPLQYGARFGPLISAGQWWRLFTPIFLHGSLSHLAANMYSLMAIGPQIEAYWGHVDYLLFYILSGLAGNVVSNIFSPNTVSVGASTSLFGLIGAQAMLIYKNRTLFRDYKSALTRVLSVVVLNVFTGMQGGIDNWGHIGGLLGGALMAYLAGPVLASRTDFMTYRTETLDAVSRGKRRITFALSMVLFLLLDLVF